VPPLFRHRAGAAENAGVKTARQFDIRTLEGRRVNVALADGSVLGPVPLVLARRNTLWIVNDGEDTFVPLDRVVDVWHAPPRRATA
jgi:prepilin-type processing-associated H-X9-DG protein